jgi:hypothetical protein
VKWKAVSAKLICWSARPGVVIVWMRVSTSDAASSKRSGAIAPNGVVPSAVGTGDFRGALDTDASSLSKHICLRPLGAGMSKCRGGGSRQSNCRIPIAGKACRSDAGVGAGPTSTKKESGLVNNHLPIEGKPFRGKRWLDHDARPVGASCLGVNLFFG